MDLTIDPSKNHYVWALLNFDKVRYCHGQDLEVILLACELMQRKAAGYLAQGRLQQAREKYFRCISLFRYTDPQSGKSASEEDYAGSRDYGRVLDCVQAVFGKLSVVCLLLREHQCVTEAAGESIALNPDNPRMLYRLATAMLVVSKQPEYAVRAQVYLEYAAEMSPHDADIRAGLKKAAKTAAVWERADLLAWAENKIALRRDFEEIRAKNRALRLEAQSY